MCVGVAAGLDPAELRMDAILRPPLGHGDWAFRWRKACCLLLAIDRGRHRLPLVRWLPCCGTGVCRWLKAGAEARTP